MYLLVFCPDALDYSDLCDTTNQIIVSNQVELNLTRELDSLKLSIYIIYESNLLYTTFNQFTIVAVSIFCHVIAMLHHTSATVTAATSGPNLYQRPSNQLIPRQ